LEDLLERATYFEQRTGGGSGFRHDFCIMHFDLFPLKRCAHPNTMADAIEFEDLSEEVYIRLRNLIL
jgi:hypothetical protein